MAYIIILYTNIGDGMNSSCRHVYVHLKPILYIMIQNGIRIGSRVNLINNQVRNITKQIKNKKKTKNVNIYNTRVLNYPPVVPLSHYSHRHTISLGKYIYI